MSTKITANEQTTKLPNTAIASKTGYLTIAWQFFFRRLSELLDYIWPEIIVSIENNVTVWTDIPEVKLDYRKYSAYCIEFVSQRFYTIDKAFDVGTLYAVYLFGGAGWNLIQASPYVPFAISVPFTPILINPNYIRRVVFQVTADGKLQYQTFNLAGAKELDRVCFRIRPIAAKTTLFSEL